MIDRDWLLMKVGVVREIRRRLDESANLVQMEMDRATNVIWIPIRRYVAARADRCLDHDTRE